MLSATLAATEPPTSSSTTHEAEGTTTSKSSTEEPIPQHESSPTSAQGSPPLRVDTNDSYAANGVTINTTAAPTGGKLTKTQTTSQSSQTGRPRGGTRSASKGGGVQRVLGETGSWPTWRTRAPHYQLRASPGWGLPT